LQVLAQADHIFIEELLREVLYDEVSQAFAVYLPVKSVGVTGDQRRYEHVIALRAVIPHASIASKYCALSNVAVTTAAS